MQIRSSRRLLARRKRRKVNIGNLTFDVANYVFLALLGLITVGPFLYLIAGSLTDATAYRLHGVSINPAEWTLNSYRILLGTGSRVYQALKISVLTTVVGTFLSLLITAAMACRIA